MMLSDLSFCYSRLFTHKYKEKMENKKEPTNYLCRPKMTSVQLAPSKHKIWKMWLRTSYNLSFFYGVCTKLN